jgi:YD repeat-containing protein
MTDAAYLQYAYYPDGTRSSLIAANQSGGATLFGLVYSDRADGLLQSEKYTYGSSTSTISLANTPAGRFQSVTSPWGSTTQTQSYDAYGRLSSLTTASATVSALSYDDEGEKTGETISNPASSPQYIYNVRGELVGGSSVEQQSANGVMVPTPSRQAIATAWDVRSGAVVGETYNTVDQQSKYDYTAIRTYTYDALNRLSSLEDNRITPYTDSNGTACHIGTDTTSARNYDGAGHLVSIGQTAMEYPPLYIHPLTCPPNDSPATVHGPNLAYKFGSSEHPLSISASSGAITYYPTTLHWDGDSPLFESSSNSGVLGVFLGAFADSLSANGPSAVQMDERDEASYLVEREYSSASGTSYTGGYDPFHPTTPWILSSDNYGTTQANIYLDMPRIDGITDSISNFQGVRDYDSTQLSWAEPDPAGALGEGYSWEGNNPLTNEDPSGYFTTGSIPSPPCQQCSTPIGGVSDGPFGPEYFSFGMLCSPCGYNGASFGGAGGQVVRLFDCMHRPCLFGPPSKACTDATNRLNADGGSVAAFIDKIDPQMAQVESKASNPEPIPLNQASKTQKAIIRAYRAGNAGFVLFDYVTMAVGSARAAHIPKDEVQVYNKCNLPGTFNGPPTATV